MSCKTPAAFVAALASLAVIAPAASAAVTTAPLTVATSGDNATFTIAAPAQSPDMIALLIANADSGSSSFAYTMVQGVGEGAVTTKASTDACQVVNGTSVTLVKLPETQFSETSGFTVSVPTSVLPASFDAKAVYVDDFNTDICSADADNIGVATTMAGATRFPAPVVAPVVAPVLPPAPVVTPVAPVAPAKPVADPDKDGIANDWLVGGKPAAAPKAAKLLGVTAHVAKLALPKAPKGATLRVYRRVAGTGTFRAVAVKASKKTGTVTVSGLKRNTRYELKLVAVNKAGQQTTASKPVTVKTAKA